MHVLSWDQQQVCQWVGSIGLERYARLFQEHQIVGELLPFLEDSDLKDMGIDLIGPRAKFRKEIQKLSRATGTLNRNKLRWEAEEQLYDCCCEAILDTMGNCCVPLKPGHYRLTGAILTLTTFVYPGGRCCKCLGKKREMNNMDLHEIRDIDVETEDRACCGGHDTVTVVMQEGASYEMTLPRGTGPAAQQMIRDAVEDSEERRRLVK